MTNLINRLRLQTCYISGPMDAVADRGEGWRNKIKPWLNSKGVIVYNPCKKDLKYEKADEEADFASKRRIAMCNEDYDKVTDMMKPVRRSDLRFVDVANFLIVNLDLQYRVCGTLEETFMANIQRKPVIIHCPQGKKEIPPWLFAVLPHQLFFGSWNEVKDYLSHIDGDKEFDSLNRWHFFDIEEQIKNIL